MRSGEIAERCGRTCPPMHCGPVIDDWLRTVRQSRQINREHLLLRRQPAARQVEQPLSAGVEAHRRPAWFRWRWRQRDTPKVDFQFDHVIGRLEHFFELFNDGVCVHGVHAKHLQISASTTSECGRPEICLLCGRVLAPLTLCSSSSFLIFAECLSRSLWLCTGRERSGACAHLPPSGSMRGSRNGPGRIATDVR